jgi:hypothetical protein
MRSERNPGFQFRATSYADPNRNIASHLPSEVVVKSLVQALCDIDCDYQSDLAALEEFPEIAELFARRLRTRYEARRAPHIKALAELHRKRKAAQH